MSYTLLLRDVCEAVEVVANKYKVQKFLLYVYWLRQEDGEQTSRPNEKIGH